ncbi:ABC transporter ATP-binding protein [Roseobacter denitrificans]|uniref:Branched-chain amino acid ABC transporter, ATP-binding protein n=1 Tax=Roseobacter denitrificans (strain ATCC 33942 / OCh 114) TaxID=375451 RepID=Q16A59_ROSDO|nr:ABC transporter ATP-binding protein [Roseobacter denitrificans]ABG31134.1 branched-chain amino acid ABC transporter, ATP-binding protein [Roseobacter denitrificans OCh 114]AVL54202.1 ABC transporter ATP-binding protein [Roseobacter denitrificans]SFG32445.1 amino acid/amide ABC transporter ATP-binding protein 1, HAAT family [Roseobacter denitrificans OCh 114]
MLELNGIDKSFGGVHAVRNVSLTLAAGEVRGLIGPNGAGKSTLVNLISGLLVPTAGTITLEGQPITRQSAHERARKGIARTFQNLRVFPSLTVEQNIDVARYAGRGAPLPEAAIDEFGLRRKLTQRANALSYGDQRRLEIVRGLALRPKVLMLDEPAAGMNEEETEALGRALTWVQREAECALFVIDHDLKFIMNLCERITVLDMGAIIAEGTPEEVTKNPKVVTAYLGEDAGTDA